MARAWAGPPVLKLPTAQALAADFALTPLSPAFTGGLGLATWVHLVPFQCRIKVPVPVPPTAQALLADVAATPDSPLGAPPGLGLATRVHLVPFQCRMRVCCGGGPVMRSAPSPLDGGAPAKTTAQASFAGSTRPPDSSLSARPRLGVATC